LSRASRRWTLKDPEKFRWAMKNPGRITPYSLDSLAEASGCGKGLIEKLANGTQKTADYDDATSISEALGVLTPVLFAPPMTPKQAGMATEPTHQKE
jgi:hypothetical protein